MNLEQPSPWQWANDGPQRGFALAFAHFRGALEHAWSSPEHGAGVAEAYARCAQALQEPLEAPEAAQRVAEAHATYREALRAATQTPQVREAVQRALRQYVAELVEAWIASRPQELGATDLAAIAQSMSWVANVAADIENA